MMRHGRRTVTLLVFSVAVVACGPARSTVTTGSHGLRTFSVARPIGGKPMLCTASAAVHPVIGTLMGRPGAREPVWISDSGGRPLSVVWPEGFVVGFEPDGVLYDDRGARVAEVGDRIELQQVAREGHAGTYEDPYVASGLVFDGCYHFVP
jgi:hypothetical protein